MLKEEKCYYCWMKIRVCDGKVPYNIYLAIRFKQVINKYKLK